MRVCTVIAQSGGGLCSKDKIRQDKRSFLYVRLNVSLFVMVSQGTGGFELGSERD